MAELGCTDALLSLSNPSSEGENRSELSKAPSKELKNAVLNLIYVEMQSELAAISTYNHEVLGCKNITHFAKNSLDVLKSTDTDWIYADPARRNSQGDKVILFKDCQPNVLEVIERYPDKKILIKTSLLKIFILNIFSNFKMFESLNF